MHENFFHKLKVYYEDTDSGGVVYYANYLKFLERARTEALNSIGYSNKKVKDDFKSLIIVKTCNIEYKKPSYLENVLTIKSFIKSATKSSLIMSQLISNEEFIVVECQVHLVFINEKGKPVRIPEIILNNFKPYFCDSIKI